MTTARLASRALIALQGPDWRSFLQGLITQDVETVQAGELRYGALLTPQGRLLNDLFVMQTEGGALLDVSADGRAELMDKLILYRLRAKVEIGAKGGAVLAAWGDSPNGEGWMVDPRLPELGWRRLGGEAAGAGPEAAYDAHRLALGVPDPIKDGRESDYPIELNFDLLHGIDFRKGCFVGQETTSRMHRRGQVKTRMAPIVFEGPPPAPSTEVLAGSRLRAGEVRGGEEGRALALLRMDRAAGAALSVEDRPVALDLPPWLVRSFQQADEKELQS